MSEVAFEKVLCSPKVSVLIVELICDWYSAALKLVSTPEAVN
jgi:hypothetical protein